MRLPSRSQRLLARYGGVNRRRLGEVTGGRWDIDIAGRPLVMYAAYHPSRAFQLGACWLAGAECVGYRRTITKVSCVGLERLPAASVETSVIW